MPKGKVVVGKTRSTRNVRRKFKIGNRKSTNSALFMSTEELLERYPKAGRDKPKIMQVLHMRRLTDAQIKGGVAKAEAA